MIGHSSVFLSKLPITIKIKLVATPDDHGDETSVGHERKILFLHIVNAPSCSRTGSFHSAVVRPQQYFLLPAPL